MRGSSRLFCLPSPSTSISMAFDAADNSPSSRSHFKKSVSLRDWWLTKPQSDDDRNTIGVSGLTSTSQLNRAERCFSSAPIVKAYDFFELETVDGVCVILQGYINKEKTLGSGFSSEVFDHFVIGFPSYWEEFSTSCPQRGSSDECVSKEHEDEKHSIEQHDKFHDMNNIHKSPSVSPHGPTETECYSYSGKRSRSGRVLLPSLEFWRNQTVVYDAGLDRQVTGVSVAGDYGIGGRRVLGKNI
ncbi:unnamed protein product [Lactuca saligna]|uniref:SANTA domain-containing protein n=1 Tax=Lactuca saligna TaxID=75948 RepID=A0AA36EDF4_LACSI|nr:unnamed protein product [Lactuca saligna]